jgi:hypothetical protein
MTGNVCNIYHTYIHADVSHIGSLLAINDAVSLSITEATIKSIGISYGYGSDTRRANKLTATAVAYCLSLGYIVYLKNRTAQCTNRMKQAIAHRTDTIESKTEANHIEVILGEALYARRVTDMSQYLMREGRLQCRSSLNKACSLLMGKSIKLGTITTRKMREHRTRNDSRLSLKTLYKARHLIGAETKAAHTSIYLDVYGIMHIPLAFASTYHLVQ